MGNMAINLGNYQIISVLDGDTIQVDRSPMPAITKRKSLRLYNIDTEETKISKLLGPKTDFGEKIKREAQNWFQERENRVELKTDGDEKICGFFHRPLVHVFVGNEHYQQHAIASGWTPYFSKYGYSIDHHQSFIDAEEKAKKDKSGIWSKALKKRAKGRPYELLRKWWDIRADQIQLAKEYKGKENSLLSLMNAENYKHALDKATNEEEAQIFGEIRRPSRYAGSGLFFIQVKLDVPFYIYISRKANNRDQIIEYIENTYISNATDLPESLLKPNYVFLKGKLNLYRVYNHQIPEMIIYDMKQISPEPIT